MHELPLRAYGRRYTVTVERLRPIEDQVGEDTTRTHIDDMGSVVFKDVQRVVFDGEWIILECVVGEDSDMHVHINHVAFKTGSDDIVTVNNWEEDEDGGETHTP